MISKNKVIIIIPARSGSKRIINKNLTLINGIPVIEKLLIKLQHISYVDNIYVSTDSEEINNIADRYGASLPNLRHSNLSDDYTSSEEVIRNVIELKKLDPECYVFCLYPFSLFFNESIGLDALTLSSQFNDERFIISGSTFSPNPFRHTFVEQNSIFKILFPENNKKRSQDLPNLFFDAGLFYLAKVKIWLDHKKFWYNNNFSALKIPKKIAIDVDLPEDLDFFLNLFNLYEH